MQDAQNILNNKKQFTAHCKTNTIKTSISLIGFVLLIKINQSLILKKSMLMKRKTDKIHYMYIYIEKYKQPLQNGAAYQRL